MNGLIVALNYLLWLGTFPPLPAGIDVDQLQPWEPVYEVQLIGDQGQRDKKIETFDLNQQRTGHITVDPKTGRIDTFDRFGNRTGYGSIEKDGYINLYDRFGNRVGSGRISK